MNTDNLGIYYRMLNIAPGASAKEIKLAYRKLAFEFHPDRNTDPDSEDRFKDITEAYANRPSNLAMRPQEPKSPVQPATGHRPLMARTQRVRKMRTARNRALLAPGANRKKPRKLPRKSLPAPIRPTANSRPRPMHAKATFIPARVATKAKRPNPTLKASSSARSLALYRPNPVRWNSRSCVVF